jgi:membrane fusion protein (multidrug efflux system)
VSNDQPANATSASGRAAARRQGLLGLGAAVLVGLGGWATYAYVLAGDHETTDDAYVAGHIVQVTARDPGTVIGVYADATQTVKAGDRLADLDPALADAQLAAAEAQLASAVRAVRGTQAKVQTAEAEIAQANVRLSAANNDLARRQQAVAAGAITGEEAAHASDAVQGAKAALALAQSHRADALSSIEGAGVANNPAVLAAAAAVRRAAIVRAHMHIVAPVDGVVAQRSVQLGQQVGAGAVLMNVVPLGNVWVDANFRETQLARLRMGQPVTIKADAYGDKVSFHGRLVGVTPGSGNAFALLPPQNASGNWIKIVQRVPVRIALDPADLAKHPLRLGLSIAVDVDTHDQSGAAVVGHGTAAETATATDAGDGAIEGRIAQIIAANSGGANPGGARR